MHRFKRGVLGISLALVFLMAAPVQAAALTTAQIQAIIGLLQSFGADQSVITNVYTALGGQSSAGSAASCVDLTYNLYVGKTDTQTNGEVTKLQQFLHVVPATGYFGPLTEQAVQQYQTAHSIVSSGSPDTTGFGVVGPVTRASFACNGTSTPAQNPDQNNNQNSVPVVNFSATPNSITQGDSATLSWKSSDATSCTGNGFSGSGVSGSASISPTQDTVYFLTCTGPGGSTTRSVSVLVAKASTQPQLPTVSLVASPTAIVPGQTATLTWGSTNASSCVGTGFTASGTSGSVTVSPNAAANYSLTCSGANGSASASTTVAILNTTGAPTVSLTASPAAISMGQSATLTWSSTNADSCTGTGFTASGTSGSATVSPTANATYSISCTGANGSANTSTSVTVTTQSTQPGSVSNNPISDVRNIIPAYNPALDAVAPPKTLFGTGKIWHVGPTEQYKSFRDIASQLGTGDIVEIDAATYGCHEQSIKWTAKNITVVGVGGRPVFNATGCAIDGDKGIFNPQGTNMIIANIEFMGAAGGSGNDAGIRLDGGGYVYLTNDYFHDNQDGILMTPYEPLIDQTLAPTNDIVVDHSEFANNGLGDGYTHNIYVSTSASTHSFTLRFSYSHNAKVGHDVKSRADINYILYNRIEDRNDGTASYNIDLPQGGRDYVIGNVIQKGLSAENSTVIEFAWEGALGSAAYNPEQAIYVINNTIVNQFANASMRHLLWANERPSSPTGLTDARIENNVIVGMTPAQMVFGNAASKVRLAGNVFVDNSSFVDGANRIYNLVAGSPAIGAGVTPGTGNGLDLTPKYEFVFPAGGQARPAASPLDAGAYAYVAGQKVTPAPTITFSAAKNPVDFNTPVTLTWSTTNATYCTAGGAWGGVQTTSGSFTSQPLTANAIFQLSCTGPSGTVNAPALSITVNDSAAAQALGTYVWKDLPNTKLTSVCPSSTLFPKLGSCGGKGGMATGVYVPDTNEWYLIGGSGNYGYLGNEVYGFNFNTMKSERVTDPTDITKVKEYNGNSYYPLTNSACSRALHLQDGTAVIDAAGVTGQAAWDPITKKIVLGPWAYQRQTGCTDISNYLTDQWTFDPVSKAWAQVAGPDTAFQSTGISSWFLDPSTGIAYIGTAGRNASPIGAYLLDYSTTPPTKALVDNTWPFATLGTTAVDPARHVALQIAQQAIGATPKVGIYDLNGLSMAKYGTDGSKGSTGVAGGSGPQFDADTSWTVTGDTTLLSHAFDSLTYNPKLDMFVAWTGADKIYFIQLNYSTKTANIFSKTMIGGPSVGDGYGIPGYFAYIPTIDAYLAFSGMSNDFYLLVPPGSTASANLSSQVADAGSSQTAAAAGALTETLSRHDSGPQVSVLQSMLKGLGTFVGDVTGYFGPQTQAAVTQFQSAHGLDPVGIVGPLTRGLLNRLFGH